MRFLCVCALLLSLFFSSCDSYNQVVKSTDVEFKLTRAKEYYNSGDYFKAKELFAQLLELFRNDPRLEEIYFFYAYCFYGNDEYQQASFQFKNYVNYFPNSTRADECQYMVAKCTEQMSPQFKLDQTYTDKSIEAYNLYLKKFPKGQYREKALKAIDDLQLKLEDKALNAAMIYFKTENYKSAVVAFASLIETFPNSTISEEAAYYLALCHYQYAVRSVEEQQKTRFTSAKSAITLYFKEFSNGKWHKKALDLQKDIDKALASIK